MELLLKSLPYIQIALAVLLTGAILMQQRGAGLGGAFGGNEGTIHYERRGFERTLFRGTVVLAIVFVLVSALPVFITIYSPSTQTVPVDVTRDAAQDATDASAAVQNIQVTNEDGKPVDVVPENTGATFPLGTTPTNTTN